MRSFLITETVEYLVDGEDEEDALARFFSEEPGTAWIHDVTGREIHEVHEDHDE